MKTYMETHGHYDMDDDETLYLYLCDTVQRTLLMYIEDCMDNGTVPQVGKWTLDKWIQGWQEYTETYEELTDGQDCPPAQYLHNTGDAQTFLEYYRTRCTYDTDTYPYARLFLDTAQEVRTQLDLYVRDSLDAGEGYADTVDDFIADLRLYLANLD